MLNTHKSNYYNDYQFCYLQNILFFFFGYISTLVKIMLYAQLTLIIHLTPNMMCCLLFSPFLLLSQNNLIVDSQIKLFT